MTKEPPSNEALRHKNNVIDQRQQQIDPAGHHRVDPNEAAKRSQKQPGQDLADPHRVLATSGAQDRGKDKLDQPGRRENAQGEHEGSRHDPEEFDVMNPQKQGIGTQRKGPGSKKPSQDK